MLGLPDSITACLFDMDGVLTETATVHAAAWKETFDALLQERADRDGTPFVPFDIATDYVQYVDGRKREDGVRTFLASRDITLPDGDPGDPPGHDTVWAVGNAKNRLVLRIIDRDGVLAFPGSVRYLHAVRAAGLATAVVSASANAGQVLTSAGTPTCSTRASTASWPARSTWPASRPPTPSWPRRACSTWTRPTPRSSRTRCRV